MVVCGGSLAGAATALLLLRARPGLRVAIVEKSERFPRRVGEATVEISAYFLGRVLGLTQHLNECHLAKQGMRFWFANESARTLEDCSELGSRYLTRLPSWQVDRSVLDEEVLRRAVAAGATLIRPAKAVRVELAAAGCQKVTVESAAGRRASTAAVALCGHTKPLPPAPPPPAPNPQTVNPGSFLSVEGSLRTTLQQVDSLASDSPVSSQNPPT